MTTENHMQIGGHWPKFRYKSPVDQWIGDSPNEWEALRYLSSCGSMVNPGPRGGLPAEKG